MIFEEINFSRSTFQGVVNDQGETYYPLIQLDDQSTILSAICSCNEEKDICSHAHALKDEVLIDHGSNISQAFEKSFIRAFCLGLFANHQEDLGICEYEKDLLWTLGEETILFKGSKAFLDRIVEIIENPEVKDETNSLEFSSLPEDELRLYEARRPSYDLRFRLSNFNDLAKFLFNIMVKNKPLAQINFEENKIWQLKCNVDHLEFFARVEENVIIELIPHLDPSITLTPLYEGSLSEKIELFLDEETLDLRIDRKKRELDTHALIDMGEYVFLSKIGFFKKDLEPIFYEKKILDVPKFFEKYRHHITSFLANAQLHKEKEKAHYHLSVSPKGELVIELQKVGNIQVDLEDDALFSNFLLHNKQLFIEADGIIFDQLRKVIPKEGLKAFFVKYRQFLKQHQGFDLHMSAIQENLGYVFSKKGLEFIQKKGEEAVSGSIDAGEYVYIPQSGFYPKVSLDSNARIVSGLFIPIEAIESFIHENRADLHLVKDFFYPSSPLENVMLSLELSDRGTIVATPVMVPKKGKRLQDITWLGSYTFCESEGFCEVPTEMKLPVLFSHKSKFGLHELFGLIDLLGTSFKDRLQVDPRLQLPEKLSMMIEKLTPEPPFFADGYYVSELGKTPISYLKKAYEKGDRSICTEAGLLDLTQERFGFLKHVSFNKEGLFQMDALSFYKLSLYENIEFDESLKDHRLIRSLDHEHENLPLDLTGYTSSLRPYQETGVKWLQNLYRLGLSGLLCDEMGLGKTHQAIAFIATLANQKMNLKTLVVCPTSVLYHWEKQLKSFLPNQSVLLYHGQARSFDCENYESGIILTSYGVLRSDIEMFSKIEFGCAVFDELQIAKNPSSKVYAALSKIQTAIKVGLSGTPIENTIEDLKALFDLLLPRLLPKTSEFKEKFLIPIEKNYDKNARLRLNRVTAPFIMRRLKKDVLKDLPEKIESDMLCELSPIQEKMYAQIIKEQQASVLTSLQEEGQGTMHVFALLTKLKQLCDHPYLLDKSIDPFAEEVSGKWDLFVELLHEARDSGQKVVVFSQYLEMLSLIEKYLKKHKIGFASIRGSSMDRKEQVKRFQEDPNCEVFVGSLLASGVGIDLTAASVVIHYDRWWNPAKEAQATDRVHRIGQNRGVQVFKLITKDTIEERIDWLIKDKLRLIDTLSTDEGPELFKNFTKKELLALVESLA